MIFTCDGSSIGPISRGMKRWELRKFFGSAFLKFKKVSWAEVTTDNFSDINIHVFYCGDDRVSGVEIFRPNKLLFRGIELLDVGYDDLILNLRRGGVEFEEDGLGLIVEHGIFSIYVPDKGDESNPQVKAVYVDISKLEEP